VLKEEAENIEDLAAEMSALQCTYDVAQRERGGAKFKTPALAPAQGVEYLKFHREDALGDRIDTISVADLLKEIEVLAVVRQSNNVNTLAMISAKQERDEPVRQFTAHLCGLAAVCDLSVTCTCRLKVSEVDKWVRLSLIGGLNGEATN
jgi:hypothetical protein